MADLSERERQERIESLRRQREICLRKINRLEEKLLSHPTDVSLEIQLDDARKELERIERGLAELENLETKPPPQVIPARPSPPIPSPKPTLGERFVFLVSDRNVQLVVLVVAILTCIAAWLVVPQVQQAIFGPTPSLTVIRSETVVLRTSRDRYVTAMDDQPGWNWELRAETRNLGDWEKFTLLCLNNGKIALKTHHDRYVTATDATYEWKLRAETRNLGDWEQFTVVNAETEKEVPCSEVFGLFEQIALRTSHGRYVTAMNDQPGWNWELRAETRSLSYWEKFTLAPTD